MSELLKKNKEYFWEEEITRVGDNESREHLYWLDARFRNLIGVV